ncbi:hypothetical protein SERLADRAFT_380519 [Serpula lacrymans var. lacrymans S7.9]|uniref:Protein kinase domain-containing protein n=1 Tax=Serpula lacrymans var. lacrymans (strain S7.9) TaxID=578457 RepID=F8NLQ7_SERL9|nr:uncharacterized protein SERLADRAFT_380519 [Serpula lacrymans var. lacrymans S7.9]EGO28609.1 hypothetical protein SERLADRAFT_380519 [Serpula lacrymans var. lacrymans S7.9]
MRGSPHSSFFSSESSSTNMESLSESSSSSCPDAPLNTPKPIFSKGSISPSPLQKNFGPDLSLLISTTDTFGGVVRDEYGDDEDSMQTHSVSSVIEIEQDVDGQEIEYAEESLDWIAQAIAPLREFVVPANPRQLFADLQEVAEGDSGSVYAARVLKHDVVGVPTSSSHLAIKSIAIPQTGSAKFKDLQREMKVMKGIRHENILCMDALYVDLVDDSLWIRMELMERSLADVVGLVSEGLSLQERMIGRFASDVLLALEYLQKQHIAHRDVRSDNLLLNSSGVVKLADFSNAARLARDAPMCFEAVGVIYWQAPEMRAGAYNAMKVDVWSLGATVWELAQTEPPFADVQDPREIGDQWPSLSHPEYYSRAFHDFLRLCSRPSSSRPNPSELLNTPFIRNACGRAVNVQLLSQCRAIEENIMQRENDNS